jgi:hypothetical protein
VVVALSAVMARPVVVVVGSTVLTGSGGGSVVVGATGLDVLGAGGGGLVGLVGFVGLVGLGFAGRAGVAGPRAPGAVGAIPGGDCGPGSMVEADDPVLVLEDAGPVGRRGTVVGGTPKDLAGSSGTKAVEATIAAATAKVSPKATSIRRQGGRCSARWRGLGGGMARRWASWGRCLGS